VLRQITQPERESKLVKLRDSPFLKAHEANSRKDHQLGRVAVSPRITSCLFVAMGVGFAAAIWTYTAGWGLIAAFFAYSLAGSTALVAVAVLATLIAERQSEPSAIPRQPLPRTVTAHTG
jgi:hypothetical protein